MRRLLAIGFIWAGCALAWLVLGTTLVERSGESSGELLEEVHGLWGPPLQARPPSATYTEVRKRREQTVTEDAQGREQRQVRVVEEEVPVPLPLVGSDVAASLSLEHRRKGLLWFPTYGVDFRGAYAFSNTTGAPREVTFRLPLLGGSAALDGFAVRDAGGREVELSIEEGTASWTRPVAAGARAEFTVAYRSRGTTRWDYVLGESSEARDFKLALTTDFAEVDFPAGTLSPTRHEAAEGRWRGTWEFNRLVSTQGVGVELPQRLNPGPLASRITFFAPVSLLFFFFVVALMAEVRGRAFHPLNYFLLGCAFFAFHLLLAYLVDHVPLWAALTLASAVSLLLSVTYVRLFTGWRFALREVGVTQLVYLVGFSLTFLLTGFTGLAITLGAVVTLALMMQVTGRREGLLGAPRRVREPEAPAAWT